MWIVLLCMEIQIFFKANIGSLEYFRLKSQHVKMNFEINSKTL